METIIKTIKLKKNDWEEIEQKLKEQDISFNAFAKKKLLHTTTQNNNCNCNCKKEIEELKQTIINLINKIEKEAVVNNFKEFFVVATAKDKEKLENMDTYKKGDVVENLNFVRSIILKVNKTKETLLITQFPIIKNATQKEVKLIDVVAKINKLYRINL